MATGWTAAHNTAALILMIQAGVKNSIRYGGTFISSDGQHDFVLVNYPDSTPKPSFWGLMAVNSLGGATLLKTVGYDSVNFATLCGKFGNDTILLVIANWNTYGYLTSYVPNTNSGPWRQYRSILSRLGLSKLPVYQTMNFTLANTPWSDQKDTIRYQRFLVDDTAALDLVEDTFLDAKETIDLSIPTISPSVQLIKLIRNPTSTQVQKKAWQYFD